MLAPKVVEVTVAQQLTPKMRFDDSRPALLRGAHRQTRHRIRCRWQQTDATTSYRRSRCTSAAHSHTSANCLCQYATKHHDPTTTARQDRMQEAAPMVS
jgi:hypothetical protein